MDELGPINVQALTLGLSRKSLPVRYHEPHDLRYVSVPLLLSGKRLEDFSLGSTSSSSPPHVDQPRSLLDWGVEDKDVKRPHFLVCRLNPLKGSSRRSVLLADLQDWLEVYHWMLKSKTRCSRLRWEAKRNCFHR